MLTNPKVWGDAAVQIFFALSPAWGGLITDDDDQHDDHDARTFFNGGDPDMMVIFSVYSQFLFFLLEF